MNLNNDICRFLKKKNGANLFNGYFLGLIRKYGKIPRCPMAPVSVSDFISFIENLSFTYFKGHYYVYNLTTNEFGIPQFSGYLLGQNDMMIKFKYRAKYKQQSVSTLNLTFNGGYRNDK